MSKESCKICKRKFLNSSFLSVHMLSEHKNYVDNPEMIEAVKRKGWATLYGFIDFISPVTYEEALEQSKEIFSKFNFNKE